MTEKDLRHMGRAELIEIISAMKKTEMELRDRLAEAEKKLTDRTIRVDNAGSIAEAALALNDVFAAAQAAADTYVQSVRAANADLEDQIAQAQAERNAILENTERDVQARIKQTDALCKEKIKAAEADVSERWARFDESVRKVLESHSELQSYLR